ncbi:hypothetical protein [Phormidesmis priestleyi]
MFALLPLIAFVLLYSIFQKFAKNWRLSILFSAMAWGLTIAFSTEFLSLFSLIQFAWIAGFWTLTNLGLGLVYLQVFKRQKEVLIQSDRLASSSEKGFKLKLTNLLIFLLSGAAFIAIVVGITAIAAPPNNWDSMTYHLARAVHWVQNQTVSNYPTSYTPQLYHPPFNSFVFTHLLVLGQSDPLWVTRGDRWMNLLQWSSMVGSATGVSLIAQKLGADLRGQVFAVVFSLTIPMGILQGSSTQNDYIVCFWIVCLAYFVVASTEGIKPKNTLAIAASLSLALFTKTSAYFFAFPLMLWFTYLCIREKRWQVWKPLGAIGLLVLAVNLGHYFRTYDLFGSPISGGPPEMAREYKMEVYSIQSFVSNVIRNLAIHVGTHISLINGKVNGAITVIHKFLGFDPSDPRITVPTRTFGVPAPSFNEDTAGNPYHFLLIWVAIIAFFLTAHLRKQPRLTIYLGAVVGAFLLFCFALKWQPYNARHHLTIFVLFSAFVGVVLSNLKSRRVANAIALILIVLSLPWAFNNKYRPILGSESVLTTPRMEQVFIQRKWLKASYPNAASFVAAQHCSKVGLYLTDDSAWEYPLWTLLQSKNPQIERIDHVIVDNISAKKLEVEPYKSFDPCAIVVYANKKNFQAQNDQLQVRDKRYTKAWSEYPMSVFVKK